MSTKRKIEDYKDQKVAIHCSTKEEWDKIVDLLPSGRSVIKIYWQNSVNDGKSDTITIGGFGWSPKKHFENTGYTIYPASDFLEEKPFKFNIGDEIKAKPGGYYIASPQHFAESHKKQFPSNKTTISGKITERTQAQGFNWYRCGYDNWITEEGVELVKEDIPEYVEYIDTKYKGQIVKVEEWTNHSFCCIRFENGQREQPFKNLVKPSTKEAYDLQNKPKQLTVDDLIKGGIYVLDINKNKDFISKFDCIESDNYYDCCFIHKNEFENDPDSLTISEIRNIRLATNEEKKWLNTCITQDKFISKSDLHLYDDYGLLVKTNEKMKSILEKAKKRYPIGTKFKSVVTRNLFTVESHVNGAKNSNIAFHTIESNSSGNHWGCVYENGTWAEIISLPNEIPIISDCITYNGENISKGFEVSSYYKFNKKSFNQNIYIPSITKKPKKLQTITIESTTDLNLGLTKIKSKQIQTIKI